jgi:hypothetical protein
MHLKLYVVERRPGRINQPPVAMRPKFAPPNYLLHMPSHCGVQVQTMPSSPLKPSIVTLPRSKSTKSWQ